MPIWRRITTRRSCRPGRGGGTLTYGSMRSILDNKLDRQAPQGPSANTVPVLHPNIRGPRYYH
jgi:hypothetical protein